MESFDYVIVGAGSAGCVLADRLSADPRRRVLLLEAGPRDRSPWIHLPIGYGKTMFHPVYNWGFYTDPEPNMNGRRIYWPRGRGLGGSSSINGLIVVHGQPQDLADALAKLGTENLSNLHPHPLYAAFYYSHPPLTERISALRALAPVASA